MTVGIKNSPSMFLRAIYLALGDLVHSYVVVYMDDVTVVPDAKDDALERLEVVLKRLLKPDFFLISQYANFLNPVLNIWGLKLGQVK